MIDWVIPQTAETVTSLVNGTVKIVKTKGQYSVFVNGFEQSGPIYVEKIWTKALKGLTLSKKGETVRNILILGLGCGTLVKLITRKWPSAKITGVEIDPVIIDLGRRYFGLDKYPNLKIIQADALQYVDVSKKKFDLIIVDAYIGNKKKELKIPKKLLTRKGKTITNILSGISNKLVVQ